MPDTVRFKHHAIAIQKLMPSNRILEATRQLYGAIKQQPKKSPMDKLTTIELVQEVLLGEKKERNPKNSVQSKKSQQKIVVPTNISDKSTYYDNEGTTINHGTRRSKRVMAQKRESNNDRIAFIAANETADIPSLTVKIRETRRLGGTNMHLKLD